MGVPAKLGMNRIFPRFVVLVMLAMTLATFAIYFVFSRLYGDPLDEIAMRQASGQIFLLQQYVDQAPADEWLARLNKVREVAGADVELLPLQAALPALPHSRRAALLSGAIVIDVAGKSFYRRVDLTGARYIGSDADVIHAQKLPIDVGQALRMEAIRYAIVALFLLLPIGWWSRAHWRGLQALSRVADDFGSGDLAARATVRRTSSIAHWRRGSTRWPRGSRDCSMRVKTCCIRCPMNCARQSRGLSSGWSCCALPRPTRHWQNASRPWRTMSSN